MREDQGCCPLAQAALQDRVPLGSIPLQGADNIWNSMILLCKIQHLHGLQKHVCGDCKKYSRPFTVNPSFPPGKLPWPCGQMPFACVELYAQMLTVTEQ